MFAAGFFAKTFFAGTYFAPNDGGEFSGEETIHVVGLLVNTGTMMGKK